MYIQCIYICIYMYKPICIDQAKRAIRLREFSCLIEFQDISQLTEPVKEQS